ncbi:MAG: ABC transporter substrate-binding protein [Candidatus Gracilibacteria bacterium]
MSSSYRDFFTSTRILVLCVALFLLTTGHLIYLFHKDNSIHSPTVGGSYKEGLVGSVRTPNPLFAVNGSADQDIVRLLYSGLTKYDPKQQKMVPDLATYQVSENKKEYTFFINPNAKWHDGEQINADDVLFTYKLILDPAFPNATLKKRFADVKVDKVDDMTVKFTLPKAYYFFPTATTVGILPEHIWSSVSLENIAQSSVNFSPVGSGPYKAASDGMLHVQNGLDAQIISLERNAEYYGVKPYLEKVTLEVFPDFERLLTQKDALEGIKDIPQDEVSEIRKADRFNTVEINSPRYFAAFLNMDKDALKNWRTRLALQVSVSRNEIMQKYEFLNPVNTPFLQQQEASWTNEYSLDRARGSLFDAGWKFPSEESVREREDVLIKRVGTGALVGVRDTSTGALLENLTLSGTRLVDLVNNFKSVRYNDKGAPLKLKLVVARSPEYLGDIAETIKKDWEIIGADIDVQVKETKDIPTIITNRDYDIILLGQELGYDQDIFSYWHSSQANKRGYNLSNFKNSNADILIEEMRNPPSGLLDDAAEEYISKHITDLTKIFTDEIPAIFLFQPSTYDAIDKKYQDVFWQNLVFPQDRFETISLWHLASSDMLKIPFNMGNFFGWLKKNL